LLKAFNANAVFHVLVFLMVVFAFLYRQQAAPATSKFEMQEAPTSQKAEEGAAPTSL
jgi:preprotein translocase subunit YajC